MYSAFDCGFPFFAVCACDCGLLVVLWLGFVILGGLGRLRAGWFCCCVIVWFGRRFGALVVWFLGLPMVVIVVACCDCFAVVLVLRVVASLALLWGVGFLIVVGVLGGCASGFAGWWFWMLCSGLLCCWLLWFLSFAV